MKKLMAVTVAVLLGLGVASAWAQDLRGKIQQIDPAERVIVLDDGTKLKVAEGVSMENLKEGDSVKASYKERDGQKVLTSVAPAE